MIKILTVLGARPQFIKASAVSRVIRNRDNISEVIVHTGQHFDHNMSEVFFNEMDLPVPNYNLDVNNAGHGAMTGRMLEKTESVLLAEKPDIVLVYGDTNSTLAGALAASKLHIKVAHVEAGLRSYNMSMPEEINRILTDRISDMLFCPTANAVSNLHKEGFGSFNCRILNVGDVMLDVALYYKNISPSHSSIMSRLGLKDGKFILCTVHRQENTDDLNRLRSIISALDEINARIPVVLPLHPRTRNIMNKNNLTISFEPVEPLGYLDNLELLKHCSLVATDSGGMQKEAYFFNKYCITLRDETEWTELVENGYNILAGCDPLKIKEGIERFSGKIITGGVPLYGQGNASQLVVDNILSIL